MRTHMLATEHQKASMAIYKDKTVLVTGHTGFVGSWLCLWLKRLGARVVGYALDPPTEPNLFTACDVSAKIDQHIISDVRDYSNLLSVFQEHNPEIIFHLAAQPLVRLSYAEPRLTFETNVLGTANVLEASRSVPGVRVCIVVTSDKCYKNQDWIYGYRETDALGGSDPYSSSKACAEFITASYRKSFYDIPFEGGYSHMSIATVRAGNIIGGGDWGQDRLLPDCVRALSNGKRVVLRYPRATRPWQFILDPLSGYLWLGALMYSYPAQYSGAWNFGPKQGSTITVEQLAQLFLDHWGQGKYEIQPTDNLREANQLKLDTSKANSLLAWIPVYSVNQAVKVTAAWYKTFYEKDSTHTSRISTLQIEDYMRAARVAGLLWTKG